MFNSILLRRPWNTAWSRNPTIVCLFFYVFRKAFFFCPCPEISLLQCYAGNELFCADVEVLSWTWLLQRLSDRDLTGKDLSLLTTSSSPETAHNQTQSIRARTQMIVLAQLHTPDFVRRESVLCWGPYSSSRGVLFWPFVCICIGPPSTRNTCCPSYLDRFYPNQIHGARLYKHVRDEALWYLFGGFFFSSNRKGVIFLTGDATTHRRSCFGHSIGMLKKQLVFNTVQMQIFHVSESVSHPESVELQFGTLPS